MMMMMTTMSRCDNRTHLVGERATNRAKIVSADGHERAPTVKDFTMMQFLFGDLNRRRRFSVLNLGPLATAHNQSSSRFREEVRVRLAAPSAGQLALWSFVVASEMLCSGCRGVAAAMRLWARLRLRWLLTSKFRGVRLFGVACVWRGSGSSLVVVYGVAVCCAAAGCEVFVRGR
jgi:hypothetical protein